MVKGISNYYRNMGVDKFYQDKGSGYRNPHESTIHKLLHQSGVRGGKILDLCCGSGEVTALLLDHHKGYDIDGIDPYTGRAYFERTGKFAEPYSFEDIAEGVLANRRYDIVICSFALHLCEPSRLPMVCIQLSLIADTLIILTPHKKPEIKEEWGWKMNFETIENRIRLRNYSYNLQQAA